MSEKNLMKAEEMLPSNLFILPVSPTPVFPGLLTHLMFTDNRDIDVVNLAIRHGGNLGLMLSKENPDNSDYYNSENLYAIGTVAKVVKQIKLPDGGVHVFISTVKRFRAVNFLKSGPYLIAEAEYLDDLISNEEDLVPWTRQLYTEIKNIGSHDPMFTEQMKLNMINIQDPGKLADFIAANIQIDGKEQQELLEELDIRARIEKLLIHIKNEEEIAKEQQKILDKVNQKISKNQRDFFLRQELNTIQMELGIKKDPKNDLMEKYMEKFKKLSPYMNDEAKEKVQDDLSHLSTIDMTSPEFNLTRNYLDIVFALPWKPSKKENINIKSARRVLDRDHYGMKDVKDRILEFLAVKKMRNDDKGAIICLVGAPGVGKTSIGTSIASALNKEYFRFSVGGMRDEAEIKGHRRTYIGAIPGKVIKGLQTVKANNPIFLIDEIDKMGESYQGDPASALLEVLDPEQNKSFRDNYLDIPFDLSHILFIATANSLQTIPAPLLDRMEIIEVSGYTSEEKVKIGKKYLVPKSLKKAGLTPTQVKYSNPILRKIADQYAREAGVRHFEKNLDKINRKIALQVIEQPETEFPIKVSEEDLNKFLGLSYFTYEDIIVANKPGMAVGLAWTNMGGDTLAIEAQSSAGNGKLHLTGQLGDVMQESVSIALTWLRSHAEELRISPKWFNTHDIHLHVPEGAIKKDGPSAGVTMTTALYSLITGQVIKPHLAMTGEISLMGKVLPIGGLKEKVLAAKRNKITEILIPYKNNRDLDELDDLVKSGVNFHLMKDVSEVLDLAFPQDNKAKRAPIEDKEETEEEEDKRLKTMASTIATAVKEALNG